MFWNTAFLYVICPVCPTLLSCDLSFHATPRCVSCTELLFVFANPLVHKHALCRTGCHIIYLSYQVCLRFLLPKLYVPWKRRFLYDSLRRICAVCIERGGQKFQRLYSSSLTLSAVNKVVFPRKVSTVSVKRLLGHPTLFANPDIAPQIAVNSGSVFIYGALSSTPSRQMVGT
jgi:hypothetical protein